MLHDQIRYLCAEWAELRRMRADGVAIVHAPSRVVVFLLGSVAAKRGVAHSRFWDAELDFARLLPTLLRLAP